MRAIFGVTPNFDDLDIRVNGLRLGECVAADDREGWAEVIKRDAHGEPIMKYGCCDTDKLYGAVTIVRTRPWS